MSRRTERAAFWGAVTLILGVAGAAYVLLLGRGPPAAPVADPRRTGSGQPVALAVAAASGPATVVRQDGSRVSAAPGVTLEPQDAVVTGEGGRVELAAGAAIRVALEDEGRFDVEEISAELSRFRLQSGLVSATVQGDGGSAVEIAAARGAIARTRDGDLAVARSGDVVAVGVARGAAEFQSGGRTVVVRSGEESRARSGAAPSAPAPIPASLLLKVRWPEEHVSNRRRLVVTGRTAPGALVSLGGEHVAVAPDGTFQQVLYLREGAQRITVRARDVGGHRAEEESPTLRLDTHAPDAQFDTRNLWGGPEKR